MPKTSSSSRYGSGSAPLERTCELGRAAATERRADHLVRRCRPPHGGGRVAGEHRPRRVDDARQRHAAGGQRAHPAIEHPVGGDRDRLALVPARQVECTPDVVLVHGHVDRGRQDRRAGLREHQLELRGRALPLAEHDRGGLAAALLHLGRGLLVGRDPTELARHCVRGNAREVRHHVVHRPPRAGGSRLEQSVGGHRPHQRGHPLAVLPIEPPDIDLRHRLNVTDRVMECGRHTRWLTALR